MQMCWVLMNKVINSNYCFFALYLWVTKTASGLRPAAYYI